MLLAGAPGTGPVAAQEETAPATVVEAPPADPAASLQRQRDNTRIELDALSRTITLSQDRAKALEAEIAEIDKTSAELRAALVSSADKRKALEQQISDGEQRLNALGQAMSGRLEEEQKMRLLVTEKEKLKGRNAAELLAERRKAEQLAGQATSLEGLIGTLENEIGSVRAAASRSASDMR